MSRRVLPALATFALTAGLLAATPASAMPDATGAQAKAVCKNKALSKAKTLRTKGGMAMGTARLYPATSGDDVGFCLRFTVKPQWRKKSTLAGFKHKTFNPDGTQSSSGDIGGSGLWAKPFFVTSNFYGPGHSIKGTAKLAVLPGGPTATAKVKGTLR